MRPGETRAKPVRLQSKRSRAAPRDSIGPIMIIWLACFGNQDSARLLWRVWETFPVVFPVTKDLAAVRIGLSLWQYAARSTADCMPRNDPQKGMEARETLRTAGALPVAHSPPVCGSMLNSYRHQGQALAQKQPTILTGSSSGQSDTDYPACLAFAFIPAPRQSLNPRTSHLGSCEPLQRDRLGGPCVFQMELFFKSNMP